MISSQNIVDNYQVTSFPVTFDDFATIGLVIAALGIIIAIVVPWSIRRDARAKQRLDLLGESLKNPQLDAQTRSQILSVLAKEHESGRLHFLKNPVFWQRLVFGGGWLAFVFFGGMALLSWIGVVSHQFLSESMVYSFMGLVMMSLPVAMRELAAFKTRSASREGPAE